MRAGATTVLLLTVMVPLQAQELSWEVRSPKGFRYLHPTWSEDGSNLIVSRVPEGDDGCDEVWSIPADGTDPKQIRALAPGVYCNSILADGKRMLVCSDSKEYAILSVETGEQAPLHPPSKPVFGCAPSPDGAWIAWAIGDGQSSGVVWIARPDGSDARTISEGTFAMERPSWSPDGKRLAVPSVAPGSRAGNLHIVTLDGQDEVVVSIADLFIHQAVWSPDGKRIAVLGYRGYPEMQFWIHVGAADGSGLVPFLRDGSQPHSIAWSPDSKALVAAGRLRNGLDAIRRWVVPDKFESAMSPEEPREGKVAEPGSFYLGNGPAFSAVGNVSEPEAPLFRCSADGRTRQLVVKSGFMPQGVPGGGVSFLRFTLGKEARSELVLMPSDLSGQRVLHTVENKTSVMDWRFSPDGKHVAVAAEDGLFVGQAPEFALELVYTPDKPWHVMERDGSPRALEWFPDSHELIIRMGKTWTVRALLDRGEMELIAGGWSEVVPLPGREVLCAKGRSLFRVPSVGGTRKIADLPDECVGLVVPPKADCAYALWARVAMGGKGTASASGGLVAVDLTSGETRALGDVPLVQATLSQDGSHLLGVEVYLHKGDMLDVPGGIADYDLSTGRTRVVVFDYSATDLAIGRQMAGISPRVIDWAR